MAALKRCATQNPRNKIVSSTSGAIRFNETDHLMAEFCGLFPIHQMSGIADDNAFRSGNTRLHGYRDFPNARARIAMRVGTPF
jgi:hypothetical protein